MPPISGVVLNWHSLISRHAKHIRSVLSKAIRNIDAQVAGRTSQLEAALVRNAPKHPIHPIARVRQQQSRWFSTGFRSGANKAKFSQSRVGSHIQQSAGRAPFASTLRPNLTGGTLGRTAGGYTLGSGRIGGARYFSHGPASQAQVVQNVSQGVRAFFTAGNKAQFDGFSHNGGKQFKTVSNLQDEASRTMRSVSRATPGSWIDFKMNPTITALTTLESSYMDVESAAHLNTDGLMDVLSVDFSRSLKDLAATLNDVRRLSLLGDLPITHQGHNIRVHFPGCDADTVERLCEELGIQRGIIQQDPAFDAYVGAEMALLFPYAPSDVENDAESLYSYSPVKASNKSGPLISLDEMLSEDNHNDVQSDLSDHSSYSGILLDAPASSPSAFESIRSESLLGSDQYSPLEYQGIEGIYRFIEQCDTVRR